MRLGTRTTHFQAGSEWSKLWALYGREPVVEERHRHRYEGQPRVHCATGGGGDHFISKDDSGNRMEAFELKGAPRRRWVSFAGGGVG